MPTVSLRVVSQIYIYKIYNISFSDIILYVVYQICTKLLSQLDNTNKYIITFEHQ